MLYRTDVPERVVETAPIVERLAEFECVSSRFVSRLVALRVRSLVLHAVEEAIHRYVVRAIALATHRDDHPVILKHLLVVSARILVSFPVK